MSNTYSYGRYKLTFHYKGDKGSPFKPSNENNFVVKLEDTKCGRFCHVDYWTTEKQTELTEKQGAEALVRIIQTALIGAQDPMVFSEMMGLDHRFEESVRPKFEHCRNITEAVVNVIREDFRDVMNRLAVKNGLEIARRKSK